MYDEPDRYAVQYQASLLVWEVGYTWFLTLQYN